MTPLAHAIPRLTTGGDAYEPLAGDLLQLKEAAGGPRSSVFLPVSPGSARSTKTRIRAKNLLGRAEKALHSDGLSRDGAVFVVPDADLPGSSPTAAVLRY